MARAKRVHGALMARAMHTDDDIADLPSRGVFSLLQTLGGEGSIRAAVIPSLSSFVGPLAPLFSARDV